MEKSGSFNFYTPRDDSRKSWNANFGFVAGDRRLAFSRQASFQQPPPEPYTPTSISMNDSTKPLLTRTVSSIDIPPEANSGNESDNCFSHRNSSVNKNSILSFALDGFQTIRYGNRYMKRLFVMISLNVAYSTAELVIGLFTGRVGLVSDAFHLTFGCGLLTFSLFAMATSRRKPDRVYTYGYKRLEVLSAFTNAVFLLFMSFSLAVEALHAFIQDESEHKFGFSIYKYMLSNFFNPSTVANLMVNLIGVWFFRNYARINLVYRKAEDMNYHSICLHVLADSIRSAGLILASWFLSLGVQNAEVLCLGLVSVALFVIVMPLFRAAGGILLQMAPSSIPSSALSKCWRQIAAHEDVAEVTQSRFWELVPGHVVGSLSIMVKKGSNQRATLQLAHGLYQELGVHDLTVQTDDA